MGFLKIIRKNKAVNYFIRSVIRYLLINFNSKILNFSQKWKTYGIVNCEFNQIRFKIYNECDDPMAYYFYYNHKFHEEADLKLFSILASESNVILDIGANTGLFSIISGKVNPKSEVYSFEPLQKNFDRLKKNISINNINNILPIQEAVSDQVGVVDFTVPVSDIITDVSSIESDFSKQIYPEIEWKTISVPMITVDFFKKKIKSPINLIKCDVETHEMSVFLGMRETLKSDKSTILFETFLDEKRIQFFNSILEDFDYYLYIILDKGIVHIKEGFSNFDLGLNYLITPIKPKKNYISFNDAEDICNALLNKF